MFNIVFASIACIRSDNSCVSGLQRCCSSAFSCNLFGQNCGGCHSIGNFNKTCNDVGGTIINFPSERIDKYCKSFRGY